MQPPHNKSLVREEERGRRCALRMQVSELTERQDKAWEWLAANVTHPEFLTRMREANLLAGRIEVLQERINNLSTGLPEMGYAPATVPTIHQPTKRITPR